MFFSIIDLVALASFFLLWVGFGYVMDRSNWRAKSLSAAMNYHRLRWMHQMLEREVRIQDSNLVSNLMRSISLLASTSILILGGVIAMMGSVHTSYEVLQDLPFTVDTPREVYELKLILLATVFVYTFFQFTWSLRQFNYCCILIGGAPSNTADPTTKATFVKQAARLNELGARSFNSGLRGFYFALALLCWFIHPVVMIAATACVVAILYRREFHSRTRAALMME
nr:DUF599 domain-containing protein [Telmatospirillum sp. J64-1]